MWYHDVTDPNAVLAAIKEFDGLGRENFARKYDMRARDYFVLFDGKTYDCKPLLWAAYRHQHGELPTSHASGGTKRSVKPQLEELGFKVIENEVAPKTPKQQSVHAGGRLEEELKESGQQTQRNSPVLSTHEKQRLVPLIREIESHVISSNHGESSIRTKCVAKVKESSELARSNDSLTPILRTALVINWRESAMEVRYDRFRMLFPEISTLARLKAVLETTEPWTFCRTYLDIDASRTEPEKNPKYRLLRELTDGFLEYQNAFDFPTEIDAIRHWSKHVDLENLKRDFIGRRFGVGKGVIENIRLNLGCGVVKPDRHVIGVMMHVLRVNVPTDRYGEVARSLELDPTYFDCLLFEYGKAKGISSSYGYNN